LTFLHTEPASAGARLKHNVTTSKVQHECQRY